MLDKGVQYKVPANQMQYNADDKEKNQKHASYT